MGETKETGMDRLRGAMTEYELTCDQVIALIEAGCAEPVEWRAKVAGDDIWLAPFWGRNAEEALDSFAQWHEGQDDTCQLGNGGSIDVGISVLGNGDDWEWYRITGINGSVQIETRRLEGPGEDMPSELASS